MSALGVGIARCAAMILLGLLLLSVVPARAQPVDVPATWGGDIWSRPRLTGSWFGLRRPDGRAAWKIIRVIARDERQSRADPA